jgi:cell division control protein 6
MEAGSRFILYKNLLEKVAPEIVTRGLSPEEMLRQLLKYLDRENRYLLLILDEIDYVVRKSKEKREGSVIYDLTRLNEMYPGEFQRVVGTIFISRDTLYHKLLGESERSTLGRTYINMPPYSPSELKDIINQRMDAFKLGAISEEIVDYVSEITAARLNGDCRFALDVLLYAGLIADAEGSKIVRPEYVRRIVRESYPGIRSEDLLALDRHEILVLIGVVRGLKTSDRSLIPIREAWINYQVECEDKLIKPMSLDKVREYIKDLDMRGIIDYKPKKGIAVSGATTEDLDRVLTTIMRRSEEN